MRDEDFWKAVQEKELTPPGQSRTGVLNLALLFGTAVIAMALILTPLLSSDRDSRMIADIPGDFDMISTGSISAPSGVKHYTIRRSVLQDMPEMPCIVDPTGENRDC